MGWPRCTVFVGPIVNGKHRSEQQASTELVRCLRVWRVPLARRRASTRGANRFPSGRACIPHQTVAATLCAMAGRRMVKGCVIWMTLQWMALGCTQETGKEASRGFEPRSLDSESRVLTVTPRGHCYLKLESPSGDAQSLGRAWLRPWQGVNLNSR